MRKQRRRNIPKFTRKNKIPFEVELVPGLKVGYGFLRDKDSQAELLAMLSRHPKFDVQFVDSDILINGHSTIEKLTMYLDT